MQTFMIKKLRVSGAGKIDGVVEFTEGLNIIQGRSNTGKTWILRCINYLFGNDKRPYTPATGYTDIEGVFLTERYGEICLSRKLDEHVVHVSSSNEEIDDGDYATDYKKVSAHYLNDLWLRILGLDETIEVPKSAYYGRERMSWRNTAGVFYVDEDEISKSASIIVKGNNYEDTPLLASLLFLLTGDYKKGIAEILNPTKATARRQGILDYIEERTNDLKQQRVSYIMQLEELSGTDIEKEMQELTARVQAAQQEVNELIEENKSIAQQLSEFQQKEANCRILLSRYESLISQYKADLQRLDFISKGEKAVQGVPLNDVCPFCGGKVHPEKDDTYMEAIHAEIRRIASELTVIAATVKSVQEEQAEIQGNIEELYVRRAGVNQALAEKQHAIQDYQVGLKRYRDYTTLQTGIDFVNSQLEVLGKKRVSELNPEKNPPLYHPKKEFEAEVGTNFTVLLNKILKACNYRLGGYASWDYSTFDILVDGEPKSDDQGQGYRSFLNSVVAMMLYEYFNRDGTYIKPGFLMLDTPLLGLDEDDEELDKETIRNGLYRYFIDNQGKGQVIVVDNLNAVPNIDFEAEGINVITYHKNERDGHIYGFMPSWRKDIPKEAR